GRGWARSGGLPTGPMRKSSFSGVRIGKPSVVRVGTAKWTMMRAALCTAFKPVTGAGMFARGGRGLPTYAQPDVSNAAATMAARVRGMNPYGRVTGSPAEYALLRTSRFQTIRGGPQRE